MISRRLKHFFRESGLCIDNVRLLDWIIGRPWAHIVAFRFLRFRFSPAILNDALSRRGDSVERERLFSLGMSHINVGATYKTTARGRTVRADATLLELAGEFDTPRLLEVGVSDGSSSLSLLAQEDVFSEVVLSDRFSHFYLKRFLGCGVYVNADGTLLGVKFLCFYLNLAALCRVRIAEFTCIETANPVLDRLYSINSIQQFDILEDQLIEKVHLIKCANILNMSYFPRWRIRLAVENLVRSLEEGGYLIISQNNEMYKDGEAYFVLRKQRAGLDVVRSMSEHPVEGLLNQPSDSGGRFKILFLAPSLESGGAERQMVQLANRLALRGQDVGIALFRNVGPLAEDVSGAVTVHDLRKKSRVDLVGFLIRLKRLIQLEKPDLVYSFLGVPNLANVLLKPFLSNVRCIWSVRSSNMDLSRYDWLSRVCSRTEIALSKFSDEIIVNSQAGCNYAVKQGFPAEKLKVIPNGIDVEYFSSNPAAGLGVRQEWKVPDDVVLVGIVGRLDPMKDHVTFLEAASEVSRSNPNIYFVSIGGGPLESQLKQFGQDLDLDDRIIWAGERRDLPAVYSALDICCLSSLSEGFPNVLGEAMSCGVPCIATNVGDAADILGESGIVVPRQDAQRLSAAINCMVDNFGYYQNSVLRERIMDKFSLERMTCCSEQFFRDVTTC
jgi:glycosyltransferase involved in cell wall biosynthesis